MRSVRYVLAILIAAVLIGLAWSVVERAQHPQAAALEESFGLPAASRTVMSAALQDTISSSRRNAIVAASQRVAATVVSVNVLVRETVQPSSLFEQFFYP